ncbi:MAG: hypothetical protein ACI9S8_002205 [Chlamydiales bacterium]
MITYLENTVIPGLAPLAQKRSIPIWLQMDRLIQYGAIDEDINVAATQTLDILKDRLQNLRDRAPDDQLKLQATKTAEAIADVLLNVKTSHRLSPLREDAKLVAVNSAKQFIAISVGHRDWRSVKVREAK